MRRKPRLVDKIAYGMSMFLSGPAPGFGLALGKLGGQALKGITDNVQHYRQRGGVSGKISNAIPVKAIKSRGMPSNKTKPFNVCCHTPRVHGILEEKTTTPPSSTRRFFFERVGPSHGGIGESRGLGNG